MQSFDVQNTPCYFVTEQPDLDNMVARLASEPLLAIDTEFLRTNTFYPIVGLLQLAAPSVCYLVDPLTGMDLEGLKTLLFDPDRRLVMHACSEDLEVFQGLFGDIPQNVFDTQVAASMVSRDQQLGLQRLILNFTGIEIPKDETRSDWTRRPLTQSQMEYAALDVVCLLQVYDALAEQLDALDRMAWCEEECSRIVDGYRKEAPIDTYYRTMGDAWKLKGKKLEALQALAAWRERTAREKNRPRGFIFSDRELFAISDQLPGSVAELSRIADFKPVQIRRYGEAAVAVVKEVLAQPDQALPAVARPFNNQVKKAVKSVKPVLEKKAEELGMATDRLSNRRNLEKLIKSRLEGRQLPGYYSGWRRDVLVPAIQSALEKYQASGQS
ncbi:MAG: ribonuclease D [Ketobacteraceae bacterium]|nr:ribonuclease D [Ketobacteraceae bacterium]